MELNDSKGIKIKQMEQDLWEKFKARFGRDVFLSLFFFLLFYGIGFDVLPRGQCTFVCVEACVQVNGRVS